MSDSQPDSLMTKSFPLRIGPGRGWPLGTSHSAGGLNFAVHCPDATVLSLLVYHPNSEKLIDEFPLSPKGNRTGTVWHICIDGLPEHVVYSYRVEGACNAKDGAFFCERPELFDPFSRGIASHPTWGEERESGAIRSVAVTDAPFDWEGVEPPKHPLKDLIIYEMHLRGFTADSSSGLKDRGTYLGLIEKIPYLKELGVNAVELLPIQEFDECSYRLTAPLSRNQLYNYWGYIPLSYFAPMTRYAAQRAKSYPALEAIQQFKLLVRELHRAGIEVILDVVYNHTGENAVDGPSLSYRGLDAPGYYIMDPDGRFHDYTGCGNTVNSNHPIVIQLILESLRYWVTEMHVDGFRFDLASILTRGEDGKPVKTPPILHLLSRDPVLSGVKLIAEAWDAAGLYQVGQFPRFGRVWSDWNGRFRDSVRSFLKGEDGLSGAFATALCGSSDLYKPHGLPTSSINFITAHDGFTLRDLVTYNQKHNFDNGEENRDGSDKNDSWNCGVEGPTTNVKVIALRERQMRNLHLSLMIAQGVPMLVMGDEYGHTRKGNNNTWCHDSQLNWFLWDELEENAEFLRFYRGLIHFRQRHSILGQPQFLDPRRIIWHGHQPRKPLWHHESRFVAFTLRDQESGEDLYAAFNAHFEDALVALPRRTDRRRWHCIVDTAKPPPCDFYEEHEAPLLEQQKPYLMPAHSAVLLKALLRVPPETSKASRTKH